MKYEIVYFIGACHICFKKQVVKINHGNTRMTVVSFRFIEDLIELSELPEQLQSATVLASWFTFTLLLAFQLFPTDRSIKTIYKLQLSQLNCHEFTSSIPSFV